MKEKWVRVNGYEERYEVSDLGRVRNIETGHLLKHSISGGGGGYQAVALCRNGHIDRRLLHRLLMEHFVGPCPSGHEVNHKDGNKRNFNLTNLEYVTRKENRAHAVRTGLLVIHGEHNKRAKLTDRQARQIKHSEGKIRDVGALYGVTHRIVSLIRRGLLWKHVQ